MDGEPRPRAAFFSESIVLRASPEEAFAYLGDPSTATTIDPAVISYEPSTVPMAVGTVNTIKVRLFGLRLSMMSQVLEWNEGERMVIESIRPATPVKALATHTFEPHPEGTLYTWAMEFVPTALGGSLAARFMCRFMAQNARKQQARFQEQMAIRARDRQAP